MNKMISPPLCPECSAPMILRVTKKFRTKDGRSRRFYGCSKWPDCDGAHGAHPNGRPLGTPGTKEVKALRRTAHKLLELKFGKWDEIDKKQKEKQYEWLKKKGYTHIGEMQKLELENLIALLHQNG